MQSIQSSTLCINASYRNHQAESLCQCLIKGANGLKAGELRETTMLATIEHCVLSIGIDKATGRIEGSTADPWKFEAEYSYSRSAARTMNRQIFHYSLVQDCTDDEAGYGP